MIGSAPKFLRMAALAAIALSVMTASGPAAAQDKRLTIRNETPRALVAFYARQSGKAWSSNVLQDSAIRPGASFTVNLASKGSCRYDVRAVFENRTEQANRGINVCKVGSLRYQ